MNLAQLGGLLMNAAQLISTLAYYLCGLILLAVAVLLACRFLVDALKLSPFGKFAYYATQPANRMINAMRNSQFFYPLKRAFGFDPAVLMAFIATALLCYVGYILLGYISMILSGLANSLIVFGSGNMLAGARYVMGTILIAAILFLLALMLLVAVSGWFGIFPRWGFQANERIRPLIRIFDFGGMWSPFAFIFLWLALNIVLSAVQLIFLSDVRTI